MLGGGQSGVAPARGAGLHDGLLDVRPLVAGQGGRALRVPGVIGAGEGRVGGAGA